MKNIEKIESLASIFFNRFLDDWQNLDTTEFLSFLNTKIEQSITIDDLKKLLDSKRKLHIKLGIDPTGPDVHLGHLLPIMLLNQFQKAGHQIDLIIGDFTALIGDPSGRNSQRPQLTPKQIKENFKTYKQQIGKYIDLKKIKVYNNSKWLSKLNFSKILADLSQLNLSEVLQRDDFRKRIEAKTPISVAELLYSYAQGMDSVELKSDIEVGGRDQFLNLAQARKIMGIYKLTPEVTLVTPVLEGISGDGRKMSKSYGNYIAINASLEDKFGKIMSIPDNLILQYFVAFADVKDNEVGILKELIFKNPLEAKKQLAQFIVSIETKDLETGDNERKKFEGRFSSMDNFNGIQTLNGSSDESFFDVLVRNNIVSSKSELLRLFRQNAIRFIKPEEKIVSMDKKISNGIIRVGKKKFFKIEIK